MSAENIESAEPAMVIKDLNTGCVMSINEFENITSGQIQYTTFSQQSSEPHSPPEIPSYVQFKTFLKHKKEPFYKQPFIDQIIDDNPATVRALARSPDGLYIASGGEDGSIVLYSFKDYLDRIKRFEGHSGDITDLKINRQYFILSASVDNTVRLWHPSHPKELGIFKHDDIITCVDFHPTDSGIFVACTLCGTVVVWSIRDSQVQQTIKFSSPPTAAAFSPDGAFLAIGCINSMCFIYALPDYRYVTQFIAGPRKNKVPTDKKITSIVYISPSEFLIASNDSRIRMYSTENYSLIRKFGGHKTGSYHLHVSLSPDNQQIMMPSEAKGALYLWPIDHLKHFQKKNFLDNFSREMSFTCEGFKLGKTEVITAALFMSNHTVDKMSILVGDTHGNLYLMNSK